MALVKVSFFPILTFLNEYFSFKDKHKKLFNFSFALYISDFKVAYATAMAIYSLEFTGNTTIKTELFTSDEDIQAFDMHWKRGCVVWCNGTGHVKTNTFSPDLSEYILTLKPGMS